MIIVETLDEFQSFVDIAKSKNITYKVIGSENERFEGAFSFGNTPDNNRFCGTYVLLCSLFSVWVSVKCHIDEKHTITDISSTFDFTKFEHLFLKDGNVHCHN